MSQEKPIKFKFVELPLLMDLEGPNGERLHFQLLPKKRKGEIGMYLNKISDQLFNFFLKKMK